ncbi:MAG TPA: hypothetical protein VFX15_03185 [Actinomycetes bacterium]|nr:hypothetical protein [Actinomycetes bacterium]
MTDARNVIPSGPGFVGDPIYPNELSADVELEMVYAPRGEGSTVAAVILTATNVEDRASLTVGVELTAGDLAQLRDWSIAMIAASEEDGV